MSRFIRNDTLQTLDIECADCGDGLRVQAGSILGAGMIDLFPTMHKCKAKKRSTVGEGPEE